MNWIQEEQLYLHEYYRERPDKRDRELRHLLFHAWRDSGKKEFYTEPKHKIERLMVRETQRYAAARTLTSFEKIEGQVELYNIFVRLYQSLQSGWKPPALLSNLLEHFPDEEAQKVLKSAVGFYHTLPDARAVEEQSGADKVRKQAFDFMDRKVSEIEAAYRENDLREVLELFWDIDYESARSLGFTKRERLALDDIAAAGVELLYDRDDGDPAKIPGLISALRQEVFTDMDDADGVVQLPVNRWALLVTNKDPVCHWVRDHLPITIEPELFRETHVYLAPQGHAPGLKEYLRAHWQRIAETELAFWAERKDWPGLDLARFNEWFHVVALRSVWDLDGDMLVSR